MRQTNNSKENGFGDVCESSCGDVALIELVDIDDVVYLITYIFSGRHSSCDPYGGGVPDC
ncbi:MAG: hypothetical protein KAT85_09170 [candidate division Zixibacteria bacterium]|nr:hypothetical protein [candidate division Zixibacteria bacterium]